MRFNDFQALGTKRNWRLRSLLTRACNSTLYSNTVTAESEIAAWWRCRTIVPDSNWPHAWALPRLFPNLHHLLSVGWPVSNLRPSSTSPTRRLCYILSPLTQKMVEQLHPVAFHTPRPTRGPSQHLFCTSSSESIPSCLTPSPQSPGGLDCPRFFNSLPKSTFTSSISLLPTRA